MKVYFKFKIDTITLFPKLYFFNEYETYMITLSISPYSAINLIHKRLAVKRLWRYCMKVGTKNRIESPEILKKVRTEYPYFTIKDENLL